MSFWRLYYHLVWSTKNREPMISQEVEPRLFAYVVRKVGELGGFVYAMNGWDDHIHLVVAVPPKMAVADFVKNVKGSSSHDLNHEAGLEYEFTWQRGYGALSLGEKQKPMAVEYVHDQKKHHAEQTFFPWLERCVEMEAGPQDVGIVEKSVPAVIQDAKESYDFSGGSPF